MKDDFDVMMETIANNKRDKSQVNQVSGRQERDNKYFSRTHEPDF